MKKKTQTRLPTWCLALAGFSILAFPPVSAQSVNPQQLTFAGLRSAGHQGQFNAVATDTAGNLYLLLNQKDGVRLLKTDPAASTVLSTALLGAAGDIGLAMTLDPSGNVYVTGTSTSGSFTATSGAAYPNPVDTTVNSFVAKFDSSLNIKFATFGGSSRSAASAISATADAVFITGLIYGSGLPVTPSAIIQAPASGSIQNGFVEKFSSDGHTLLYATYLSGATGDTTPAVIAADANDNAYIAGFTSATGFPTIAALIPRAQDVTSGFLTELTPQGDGITFSTFIPGQGISSLAIDTASSTLLLSGAVALGEFPVATVPMPLVSTTYQVLLRMPLDGSSVLSSTVVAPGAVSYLAPAPGGSVWLDGTLSTPLLPALPNAALGSGFAVRVSPQGTQGQTVIDETIRFGGLAASNPNYASMPVLLSSIAVDSTGTAIFAGTAQPTASDSLLPTQAFDLPLTNTPTSALPSAIHDAVLAPGTGCGSDCAGGAGYLAKVTPTAGASLALSIDAAPTIVLRNLGSAVASNLQVTAAGFTTSSNCDTSLGAGGECTILLGGTGPGTLSIQATNTPTQTVNIAAIPVTTVTPNIVFNPRELDFGIQTSTSPGTTRTITVTNLGQTSQNFTSALNGRAGFTPYSFTETASDCAIAGPSTTKQLAAGAACHITLGLAASSIAAKDGPAQANWIVGPGNVLLTGFGQAASLNVSATQIKFGTQFFNGLTSPRFLYLSNNSLKAVAHTVLALPATSPFTITDRCPTQINPGTVCQIQLGYNSTQSTSSDSTALSLDGGVSVQVTGETIPQPGTTGLTTLPTLNVSPATVSFSTPVVVTGISSSTQTVTVQNTGNSPFTLSLALTGDFTDQTNCGTSLVGGASCTVVVTFAPSQPGARTGLLSVTAGATTPLLVNLSGTATPILPANNGTLDFGNVPIGQPSVQWYKVSQPFTAFTAATLSTTFKVILVEDIGYGHGQLPASTFRSATTGSCLNCWLGIQFTPPSAGAQTGVLSLISSTSGNAYTLNLTGNGLALSGPVLTPLSPNFGPVAINSSSAPQIFTLTNISTTGTALSVTAPTVTGDFSLSTLPTGGSACAGTLAPNASCLVSVTFAPTATGQRAGTLTLQTGAGNVTASLNGTGTADPGVAFSPAGLIFNDVLSTTATQQTITVTNTGAGTLQVGAPTSTTTAFQTSSACTTLAPAATCTLTVTYSPGSATTTDTLQVPITTNPGGTPVTTSYPVALSGNYTAAAAGLEIVPGYSNFGPVPADSVGGTRQFTVNNLTAKSLVLNVNLPREFLLSGAPCAALAPNASCSFSATFVPLTAGDITGSILAQGSPTDGSASVNGIGYLEGYGVGTTSLAVTGSISPGGVVNFGQVPSGQSAQQVLTLTNTTSASGAVNTVTIRRITTRWPFLATTTCGATLAPSQSCTITILYTPLNQVASGTVSPPNTTDGGTLVIESDAISAPDGINLSGIASATAVTSPSNAPPLVTFAASESSLTFPPTAIGFTSATQAVTLANTGDTVLHIASTFATSDFTVTGNCGMLLPGASCLLNIAFSPQVSAQTSGLRTGAIEISSNSSTPLEFLSLIGTAGASTLVFQPASLSFGTQLVGTTTTLPVQITNSGNSAATFNGITTTGDYTVAGNCPAAGSTLAAGATCTTQVTFTPSAIGVRPGTLSVATSLTNNPLTVALTGNGSQSHLLITGNQGFGNVAIGSSATLSFTLANNGTAPISAVNVTATGDFAITAPCSVTTLAAGASCSVNITFTPTATSVRSGQITVSSSDAGSPVTLALSGTGVALSHLQLTPGSLSFTSTVVGSSSSLSVALQNTGLTAINSLVLTVTGDYAVTAPCTSPTLAPNATCTVMVTFTPTAAGTRTGSLTIASSDPGSPATVPLTGIATTSGGGSTGSFTLAVDGGATSTQTVAQSRSATYTLTVTPQNGFTGTVVLTCNGVTAAPSATCSMLPSSVTLSNGSQSAVVTINTITSAENRGLRSFDGTTLCLLGPTCFLFWRFRKVLPHQRLSLLMALACTSLVLLVSGCGSGGNPNLRISPSGSYQYSVTAIATTGTPVTQTVTLNLVIQ